MSEFSSFLWIYKRYMGNMTINRRVYQIRESMGTNELNRSISHCCRIENYVDIKRATKRRSISSSSSNPFVSAHNIFIFHIQILAERWPQAIFKIICSFDIACNGSKWIEHWNLKIEAAQNIKIKNGPCWGGFEPLFSSGEHFTDP